MGLRDDPSSNISIPRHKLTAGRIEKIFGLELAYLQDEAGDLVYPDDVQWHCVGPPYFYFVHAKEPVDIFPDDAEDPDYVGDTRVVIWDIPVSLTDEDVRVWVETGMDYCDDRLQKAKVKVNQVEVNLQQNKKRLDNVPFMSCRSETDAGQAEERKVIARHLAEERKSLQLDLVAAESSLETERRRRSGRTLTLTRGCADEKNKCVVFYADFNNKMEAKMCVMFERWRELKLTRSYKSRRKAAAQFEEIASDDAEFEVNMRLVRFQRIMHGKGTYMQISGSWSKAYKGDFVHGVRHGKGSTYDISGHYVGKFMNGHKNGNGVFAYANGDYFSGEFGVHFRAPRESLLTKFKFHHGTPTTGSLSFADGSVYTGTFYDGVITGEGKFENRKTGEVMEGHFENGMLQGNGLHLTSSGEIFKGTFDLGRLHGRGEWFSRPTKRVTLRERDSCVGSFNNGYPDGYCVFEYRNGNTYKGHFKDGVRQGHGSFVYGNVAKMFDKRTGKTVFQHDFEFVGEWIAGKATARSCHVTVRDHVLPTEKDECDCPQGYLFEKVDYIDYTTNNKSWSKYPYLQQLSEQEDIHRKRKLIRNQEKQQHMIDAFRDSHSSVLKSFFKEKKRFVLLYKRMAIIMSLFRDGAKQERNEDSEEEWDEQEDLNQRLFAQNYPMYKNVVVSLVDIFENPPPFDRNGNVTLKDAFDHFQTDKKYHIVNS